MTFQTEIRAERSSFVELLSGLDDEKWSRPSLCRGWTVRDVAAHVALESVPLAEYARASLRLRTPDALNEHFVLRLRDLPRAEICQRIDEVTGTGWLSRYLPRVALADLVVHQMDVRRPLGIDYAPAESALRFALEHPDPFAKPWAHARGVTLVATDLDWRRGRGPGVQKLAR